MLTQLQINNILKENKIVFSTASVDGQPRSIYVIPSRILEDKIIISNIQMHKSIENIKKNNKCFINVYFPDQDDLQYKIEGVAQVFEKGKLFDEIKKFEESENLPPELNVNSIIVVEIKSVEESRG